MAQGKQWDKEQIVQTLKPYLQLGYSVKKACKLAQFPDSTFYDWINNDDLLRAKVEAWQGMISAKARQNVASSVDKGNVEDSKWWLERREKREWSTRQEITGEDGRPLNDMGQDARERAEKYKQPE